MKYYNSKMENISNMLDVNDSKNWLILLLIIIIFFSLFGINIVILIGNILQSILEIIMPLFRQILSIIGISTGKLLNTTADVVGDTAKFTVDIAEGSVQSVGTLLQKAGAQGLAGNPNFNLSNITDSAKPYSGPTMAGQSQKSGWCLVGDYQGRRGCIEISESDNCLSGQVFPNQQMCLNPTMSSNMGQVQQSQQYNQPR